VQVPDEVVSVLSRERHERPAHEDELDLVDGVAEARELLEAVAGLEVRVVARADGAHRRRFVASVALCAVLKVRVRAAWA